MCDRVRERERTTNVLVVGGDAPSWAHSIACVKTLFSGDVGKGRPSREEPTWVSVSALPGAGRTKRPARVGPGRCSPG